MLLKDQNIVGADRRVKSEQRCLCGLVFVGMYIVKNDENSNLHSVVPREIFFGYLKV